MRCDGEGKWSINECDPERRRMTSFLFTNLELLYLVPIIRGPAACPAPAALDRPQLHNRLERCAPHDEDFERATEEH